MNYTMVADALGAVVSDAMPVGQMIDLTAPRPGATLLGLRLNDGLGIDGPDSECVFAIFPEGASTTPLCAWPCIQGISVIHFIPNIRNEFPACVCGATFAPLTPLPFF